MDMLLGLLLVTTFFSKPASFCTSRGDSPLPPVGLPRRPHSSQVVPPLRPCSRSRLGGSLRFCSSSRRRSCSSLSSLISSSSFSSFSFSFRRFSFSRGLHPLLGPMLVLSSPCLSLPSRRLAQVFPSVCSRRVAS